MAGNRGTHLITVYGSIAPELEADYTRWYDTRHIPQRMAVPGFLSAARYRLGRDQPGEPLRYLTLYELAGTDVMKNPILAKLREEQDDWDRRILSQVQSTGPGVYECIHARGEPPVEHPPWLFSVRLDVAPEADREFNHWYDTEHLPMLTAAPGVRAGRRYRKLSGQSAQYLTLYEFDHDGVRKGDAWMRAASTPWTKKMQPAFTDSRIELGQRVFHATAQPA